MNAKPVGSTGNGGAAAEDHILIRQEEASGTQGGAFTSGSWQTRVFNVKVYDTGGHASLASNQITLLAGTYRVKAHAPANSVKRHKLKLKNITDNVDIVIGTSEFASDIGVISRSFLSDRFEINATKVIELQHRCELTKTVTGLGVASSFGVIEVYSVIEFWKES